MREIIQNLPSFLKEVLLIFSFFAKTFHNILIEVQYTNYSILYTAFDLHCNCGMLAK